MYRKHNINTERIEILLYKNKFDANKKEQLHVIVHLS